MEEEGPKHRPDPFLEATMQKLGQLRIYFPNQFSTTETVSELATAPIGPICGILHNFLIKFNKTKTRLIALLNIPLTIVRGNRTRSMALFREFIYLPTKFSCSITKLLRNPRLNVKFESKKQSIKVINQPESCNHFVILIKISAFFSQKERKMIWFS